MNKLNFFVKIFSPLNRINRLIYSQKLSKLNINIDNCNLNTAKYLFVNNLNNEILFKKNSNILKNNFVQYYSTNIKNQANENDVEEIERERIRKRQVKYTTITFLIICFGFIFSIQYAFLTWGKPKKNEDGNIIQDEFSHYVLPFQYFLRAYDTFQLKKNSFMAPSREKLLPDPLRYPYVQPTYTLVLELKDLLLHPEWTYDSGWRFKKRPFLNAFLEQIRQSQFEIVIFTELSHLTALPLIENLDTQGYVMHYLFKDSTRFMNGNFIKDLNYLNRDLSKTILVDTDRKACSLNPQNCIVLSKWVGNSEDSTLLDLAVFLKTIADQKIDDVREIISHYSQFDKPLEVFKENRYRMLEEQEKKEKQKFTSLVSNVSKNKF